MRVGRWVGRRKSVSRVRGYFNLGCDVGLGEFDSAEPFVPEKLGKKKLLPVIWPQVHWQGHSLHLCQLKAGRRTLLAWRRTHSKDLTNWIPRKC
jgi:hypothetical protein